MFRVTLSVFKKLRDILINCPDEGSKHFCLQSTKASSSHDKTSVKVSQTTEMENRISLNLLSSPEPMLSQTSNPNSLGSVYASEYEDQEPGMYHSIQY